MDGAATFVRVVILLIVASVIWVPIGVWIGMNPRVSRLAQPVVQVLASFPANFLFPFAAAFFVYTGLSLNIGDFPEVLIGVAVMSVYVVGLNRLVWRRLYRLAETRYTLL